MLAGLTFLWMIPRRCTWPRAPARFAASVRKSPSSIAGSTDLLPLKSYADRRRVQESLEWLALVVLENQGRTPMMLRDDEGPHCPRRIELVPEGHLAFQHTDMRGQWMFGCGYQYED